MCLNPDRVILSLGVNVRTSSQRPQTGMLRCRDFASA